eukprot:COSAG02_NODE_37969_length_435_cov_0.723214_1_plen_109_part_01
MHNATRLNRTCAANGRLLQTEKPLTPIDATFTAVLGQGERPVPADAVWGSFSGATAVSTTAVQPPSWSQLVYFILGVDVKPPFTLQRGDIYRSASVVEATSDVHPSPWP